jgi:hypothetical protein
VNAPVVKTGLAAPPRPTRKAGRFGAGRFGLGRFEVKPWHYLLLHGLVTLALVAPLAAAQYPPLADYPNHMARIHVLAHLGQDPLLAERYVSHWSVLPNLAVDLLLVPLAHFMSVYALGRIFVVASVLVFIAGALTLFRAVQGRLSPWSFAVYPFVYNFVLAWGFLNCYLGMGLSLFACAGWLRAEARWSWRWRVPVFAVVAVALFFVHLFALGIFGLFVGGRLITWSLRHREAPLRAHAGQWLAAGIPFIIPAVLWRLSATGSGDDLTAYGDLLMKPVHLATFAVFHIQTVDIALVMLVLAVAAVGFATRSLRVREGMGATLAVMAAATLAMPEWLFNVWGADIRLPPVLGVVAVAGVTFERRVRLFTDVLVVLGVVLLGYRAAALWEVVNRHDRQVAELRAAFARVLPRGASMLTVGIDVPAPGQTQFRSVYWHLATLAVIDRSAFVPNLFTDPEKQPLNSTERYRWMDAGTAHPLRLVQLERGADPRWADRMFARRNKVGQPYYYAYWPRFYDYVLYLRLQDLPNPYPKVLERVAAGEIFALYRVRRP